MNYPKHVALIPDGNRTRAQKNNKSMEEAYLISYGKGLDIIDYTFKNTNTQILTLRGLSTENAKKRPKEEYDFLMTMYKIIDDSLKRILKECNVNFKRIGDPTLITDGFIQYLNDLEKQTKCNSDKYFIFAVNYGGRNEIIRGIKKLIEEKNKNEIINLEEEDFGKYLELGKYPNIELVIRTKGDTSHRTSGFMSWWIGYSELYFSPKKCPEFEVSDYQEALKRFDKMSQYRNYGK